MFRLDFSWEDPLGAQGAELRATWASLKVTVDKRVVSRYQDERLKSVQDHVYAPLYPLAEWIAANWWRLFHECPKHDDSAYDLSHDTRFAREGYAYPSLKFHPTETMMEVEWAPEELPYARIRFIEERQSIAIPKSQAKTQMRELLDAVLQRLTDSNIHDSFLQREWQGVLESERDPEMSEFCEAAAQLGADPFDLDESVRESIVQAAKLVPSGAWQEFFAASSRDGLPRDSHAVAGFLEKAAPKMLDSVEWRNLREAFPPPSSQLPFLQGHERATQFRHFLGLNHDLVRSERELADALGRRNLRYAEVGLERETTERIKGLVEATQESNPVFGMPSSRHRPASGLFAFCRSLHEAISPAPDGVSIISSARSERQKRNRAFAAEFLAPSPMLRERIRSKVLDSDDIEDLADEFCVSSFVIRDQILNHELARLET